MKCLYITQEYAPLFADGGLGVASSALPAALQEQCAWQHDIVMPYYPWLVEQHGLETETIAHLAEREVGGVRSDATVHRLLGHGGACEIFLIRADTWYDRGGIYRDERYVAFSDEAARAAFFGWCLADWVEAGHNPYALVHGNDWQSGAAVAHLRDRYPRMPVVFSVLSALYQGGIRDCDIAGLGLPEAQVGRMREFADGHLSLLLMGLLAADAVVTCSPTYAREMTEEFRGTPVGKALELAGVVGVVFGVDARVWAPDAIGRPSMPFDADSVVRGKALNKQALQKHVNLLEDDTLPVIGICSRVVPEKGSDLLLGALAPLLREGRVQLVLIGPASDELRSTIGRLQAECPDHLAYATRFDQGTAWLTYAGSDFTVMPSRAEPCGLNQLISYRYGTLPIVSPVGGLRDTVVDLRTHPDTGGGMFLPDHTVEAVRHTVEEALRWAATERAEVAAVRRRVMEQDWSWSMTAGEYARIYARLSAPDRPSPGGGPVRA